MYITSIGEGKTFKEVKDKMKVNTRDEVIACDEMIRRDFFGTYGAN